jgi:hypothetical protein
MDERSTNSDEANQHSVVVNRRLQSRLLELNRDYVAPWTRAEHDTQFDDEQADNASSERRDELLQHHAASDDERFDIMF